MTFLLTEKQTHKTTKSKKKTIADKSRTKPNNTVAVEMRWNVLQNSFFNWNTWGNLAIIIIYVSIYWKTTIKITIGSLIRLFKCDVVSNIWWWNWWTSQLCFDTCPVVRSIVILLSTWPVQLNRFGFIKKFIESLVFIHLHQMRKSVQSFQEERFRWLARRSLWVQRSHMQCMKPFLFYSICLFFN